MKPVCNILIGLPGVGKTTFANREFPDLYVASSDYYIEEAARLFGVTYNDIFSDVVKHADKAFWDTVATYSHNNMDFVVDRTNLTASSRTKVINTIKKNAKLDYEIRGYVFLTPNPRLHADRLASRHGKYINDQVMGAMADSFTIPSKIEGFDTIVFIHPDGRIEAVEPAVGVA